MILVDSSVWIDYFRGSSTPETRMLDSLLGTEPVIIGDLILAEVLQGFRTDSAFRTALRLLDELDMVRLGGKDIAIQAARHHRFLRAKGVTVRKTIDTIIAARCIADGLTLLHCDRDFDAFETYLGLQVATG